ncbi:NADH-quinone oxidoreductase subunit NuoN [Thioflexithrix psekupsensis]|uniref:NADH-quinone oxidoreductase subunit N n=1 Tax=Thioflexithrix psekupsensis TaxID=1570016 RepID=A0A251X9Y7_9GAMM|nr:NADH-quinone oxidoreductase subunit NuoN [Thioflexithrix psekupsensis]OUD15060.1 NADH-quinone oxidoreductase subunit N [Thioflexithrix psekupsensis]
MDTLFTFVGAELSVLAPEIFLLSMACLILVIDVYLPERLRDLTFQLSQGTLVLVGLLVIAAYPEQRTVVMSGMYVTDAMAAVLKVFIVLVVAMAFIFARPYLRARDLNKGEFYVLGLFATLGMLVMVSAHNLLTIYLGLELLSLSLYAMVAMQRDSLIATEAAMKYFILGALASGMLLYGMSMLYGVTNSLDLAQIATVVQAGGDLQMMMVFGLVFVVVGLAFKLGAVPFHMWIPDVYQGAPTAVTLFISSAPKLAAFAIVMRLLVDGLAALHSSWQDMLIILSVLSMVIGNVVAIAQTNLKRMLAYSTISHVGFLLLGIVAGTQAGYAASMFYTIVYTLMSMGGFAVILLLSRKGFEADNLDDVKGLYQRNPWYAAVMAMLMLSMAGVPPLLGFWAKWAVLNQIVAVGLLWLAIVAVVFSVIGAFYYLRVIKLMYFDAPTDNNPIEAPIEVRLALSGNGVAILALGLVPTPLFTLCLHAMGLH